MLKKEAREITGQPIKVLLPPDLERVVVTLGTIHADAEQCLAYRASDLLWRPQATVKIDWTVASRVTGGGQEFMYPLVRRTVDGHLVPEPSV